MLNIYSHISANTENVAEIDAEIIDLIEIVNKIIKKQQQNI